MIRLSMSFRYDTSKWMDVKSLPLWVETVSHSAGTRDGQFRGANSAMHGYRLVPSLRLGRVRERFETGSRSRLHKWLVVA